MNNLKEKVINTIKKNHLLQKGDKVVLAVSGGPDSICMLNVFKEIADSFINQTRFS